MLRAIDKRHLRSWSGPALRRVLRDRRLHRDVRGYAYAVLLERRTAAGIRRREEDAPHEPDLS